MEINNDGKLFIQDDGGGEQRPSAQNPVQALWHYLESRYDFHRDIVKNRILYRKSIDDISNNAPFEELEDTELNTLSVEASFAGYKSCDPRKIKMLLFSRLVTPVNPITEYLKRVSKKIPAGTPTIERLCKYIKTHDDKLFLKYFTKWLASSVANAMVPRGCQNQTCLVFIGGQGVKKTTFFTWLCPPELADYIYTGEIDLNKKSEAAWKLNDYWFVNIEEQIKALNKKDANSLKALITLPDIKGRKPYGALDAIGRRRGNWMASSNDDDFIHDHTGSRRYLTFRILVIDEAVFTRVELDNIWCEAYHYWQNHTKDYFVTQEEIEEITANNKQFSNVTKEMQYAAVYFTQPEGNDDYYLITNTELTDYLALETGNKNISSRELGIALRSCGFEPISYKYTWAAASIKVYKVRVLLGNTGRIVRYHAHSNNSYKP